MKYSLRKLMSQFLRRTGYLFNPRILEVEELIVGKNVIIEPGVDIRCRRLIIGDGVVIRSGTKIEMVDLVIGDYTKINNNCLLTGTDWCRIGHNCWFGHYSLVDSIGTTWIGNGVGVGAHSQLWTHIYFGDILEGCRFASHKPLVIRDDVWFVGHCVVSPIVAKKRSMAMVGSVITKDMDNENHIYAGVPGIDITDRIGTQFQEVPIEEKKAKLEQYLSDFLLRYKPKRNRIKIVEQIQPELSNFSQFDVSNRRYLKNNFTEEVRFMQYLLPTKAKFIPTKETDWIDKYLNDVIS